MTIRTRGLSLMLTLLATACDGGGGGSRTIVPGASDLATGDAAGRDASLSDGRVRDVAPAPDGRPADLGGSPDGRTADAGPPPDRLFNAGPYGTGFREIAGPFTVETTAGPWDFQTEWTGRDAYIFSFFTNDPRQSPDLIGFLEALWFGGRGEQRALLERSPPDVHYFFGSYDADAGDDTRRLETEFQATLAELPPDAAAHWRGRLHFIDPPLAETQGWLLDVLQSNSWLWFGIDPSQHMRQLGVPVDVAEQRPRLMQFAYEARYFAFEQARETALAGDDEVVEIPLFQGEHIGSATAEVELPAAERMAGFDTLLIDLAAYCPEHKDENCGEWDYLSGLQVCDQRTVAGNPFAGQACRQGVPEVPAVAEVLGRCVGGDAGGADLGPAGGDARFDSGAGSGDAARFDSGAGSGDAARFDSGAGSGGDAMRLDGGAGSGDAARFDSGVSADAGGPAGCRADADCGGGGRCEGYVAPVAGVQGVPAEQMSCECRSPFDTSREGAHTCNTEGTGFGECDCPCDAELGRWVTTYGREGRWVSDASPLLSLVRQGGHQRLRMQSGNAYDMHLTLRLANRGKGGHPAEIAPLWRGGGFGPDYNTGREPHRFTVPEGVTRVELVAFITGHGWGQDRENCAEFCNHTHHFTLNGHEHVRTHELAGTATGCQDQVDRGVVPNQYGTWPFGRGGWCPGLDVPAWIVDLTPDLMPDGENELTYRGLFDGADYVPRPPVNGNPQGFGAQINMTSYLVYWR